LGVVYYAFLGTAILKVKVVSPTRNKNFAVQVLINK
jgi:hypothetical protein